ncbi:DUF6879 family protein [Kitasatospora sp. NPDC057738]|uniref:DUF6879 family protein n=1 Tax=Kitasatospora sp. NPDC057738 TaxID=3346233 RepID=UPI0036BCF09A
MTQSAPDFAELLRGATRSAVHLEMRDTYSVGEEVEPFDRFRRTGEVDNDPNTSFWPTWIPLVEDAVSRGVVLRRARIVSEPVTDYVRYEHAVTPVNLAAGEQVRWLPRSRASTIALPGNDFWLIDRRLVLFHWFTGDGDWAGHAFTEDRAAVDLCSAAFEAVWAAGVPHEKFTVE